MGTRNPVDKLSEVKRVPIKTKYFDGDGTAEQNLHDEKKSCTSESRTYNFKFENPNSGVIYNLQFLDTPGLGDTAGIQKDDENIDNICETVAKTEHLNAILLIINGTEARVHSRLKYLVKRLEGMIPDQLHSNLFVLLTNVDLKPNMKAEELFNSFRIKENHIFHYDNQIFKFSPQELIDKKLLKKLDYSFDSCKETLSELFEKVSKCHFKKTGDFLKIKEGRDRLKQKLQACNDREKSIQDKKQELLEIADALTNSKAKISELQAQLYKIELEDAWEAKQTPYHNTTCLTCKNCCHEHCGLNETSAQGSEYFMQCWAFQNGPNCTQCEHSYTSHVHLREKHVQVKKEVQKIDPNTKSAIDGIQDENSKRQALLNEVQKQLEAYQKEIDELHQTINNTIQEMRSVCSKFDYVKEVEAIIIVLEEQIEICLAEMADDPKKERELVSYKKVKHNMENLLKGIQKHIGVSHSP